jgi:hypothetical protein
MKRIAVRCFVDLVCCCAVVSVHASHAQQVGSQSRPATCPNSCPPEKQLIWEPISGRVADAATAKPIVNALVTYSGSGDVLNGLGGGLMNPPSMHGEVRTNEDGSFTLPQLVPGHFEVRVSAPGYLSARQFLGEHPAGYHPPPLPSPPASYCMARFGKSDCPAPSLPDGNFALQPSSLKLMQMGDAAQAGFALPSDNPVQLPGFRAAAFSPDGQRLALLGMLPTSSGTGGISSSCVGWIYDLRGDRLERIEPQLPSKYCDALPPRIRWENDSVFLQTSEFIPPENEIETMRWEAGTAQVVASERRNGPPYSVTSGFTTNENEEALDWTDDSEYAILEVAEDCRQCDQKIVWSRRRDWKAEIDDPVSGYLLDRARDRLVTFGKPGHDPYIKQLQVLDLKLRQQRKFPLPIFRDRPELLAEQLLADRKMMVAYTVGSSCDPFGPSAPYDPPAGHGPSILHRSLCIVTLPADESNLEAVSKPSQ